MARNWKFYSCELDGAAAAIFVDVTLKPEAPVERLPWLLSVSTNLKAPLPDGLCGKEENQVLYDVEDVLTAAVTEWLGGLFCGRVTTRGRRDFFFYAEKSENLDELIQRAGGMFPGYQFKTEQRKDLEWKQYLEVLYPTPEQRQRIMNWDQLYILQCEGDVHETPRRVEHRAYFPAVDRGCEFRKAAEAAGFQFESEMQATDKAGNPLFGITVARVQAITQEEIGATTMALLHLAEHCGGKYNGWEAPVMTGELDGSGSFQ